MRSLLLVTVVAALALAGCGSGVGHDSKPQVVRGAIIATGNTVRLCSAILESYPPQCGGPYLVVEGLDLAQVAGLTTARGFTWSDGQVELRGTVADGVLRVVSS